MFLTERLIPEAGFIIGEARTAHSGGWRVLRACRFAPIGFEPFAHMTPAGVESMLLTALVPQRSLERRVEGIRNTKQVHRLASTVLSTFNLTTPDVSSEAEQTEGSVAALAGQTRGRIGLHRLLKIVRDDVAGQRYMDAVSASERHRSGVVALSRLEGLEQQGDRFERQFFIARTDEVEVGCVRVAWDGLDRRARILDLRTRREGIESDLLRGTCRQISNCAGSKPYLVSIDVRCDAITLQSTLENLGFRATAYYPGLIAIGEERIDGIQYTDCVGRQLSDGWQNVGTLDWPAGMQIATIVVGARP